MVIRDGEESTELSQQVRVITISSHAVSVFGGIRIEAPEGHVVLADAKGVTILPPEVPAPVRQRPHLLTTVIGALGKRRQLS